MTKPFFSVVIPTLNEEKYLPHLLTDLAAQTSSDFEVIIVDGQSDDKTIPLAQKFESKLKLRIITSQQRNVSWQRNLGGKAAQGTWVIFMDADNRLPAYFLDGIKYRIAREPDVRVFTTWCKSESNSPLDVSIEKLSNFGLEMYQNIGKEVAFGAMIGCHRIVFQKIRFDVNQKVWEDGLFVKAAADEGFVFKVFHDPRFVYSLRRFKKEGTLKMVQTAAVLQLKYLQGKTFEEEERYPMLGGDYYDKEVQKIPLVRSMHTFITTATKKQLSQARELLNSLKDNS